ncbi:MULTISPECIES: DUF3389 family protein [Vibrio]|uniref:DUF3389 family protein n=1 Tax=Vibrio TaxID=662 RepID=UPI000C16B8DD|nr:MULTISPECIES: DUF3389 family protein [Vibrio]NAW70188.1 DUF3389 family protein [Vibrio sp. V28_P6S34P95]NAX05563.1 DUF3389 family protein [Vibrio sp. V30_P3S12P165]NAX33778.1 DUF3389 family protein [Vibrio sp. V29_P1S30P107]NAX38538.1 DUF3389 family protein [Vibrio sp. V27_P1S3P104]NAX40406.1 DUF3389 family protein [Vibrio sp. V26_P1S5P106]
MVIELKSGKIIVTAHEILIRLEGASRITLHAVRDAVSLISEANMVVAHGSETKWSIKLDNAQQLQTLAQVLGCDIA